MLKNTKITIVFSFIFCLCMIILFSAFSLDSILLMEHKRSVFLLGTSCEVKIYTSPFKGPEILDEIFTELEQIHNSMSSDVPGNEVDRINKEAGKNWVQVSRTTFNVIEESLRIAGLTGGTFDITLGPVIKLWNIGKENERIPSPFEIKKLLPLTDYRDVSLNSDNLSVRLQKEGMMIDLGGIAKGYAADRAAFIIRKHGVKSALINLGGNIYVVGNHPQKRKWKIGIMHPRPDESRNIVGFIDASDKTLVTSGDYERFFMSGGKRYHHLLNPATGYPSENGLVSVTVVGQDSITADGLTTGLFVLGLEKGRALIESLPGYGAVFITEDKKVYVTPGLKKEFILDVDDYSIIP